MISSIENTRIVTVWQAKPESMAEAISLEILVFFNNRGTGIVIYETMYWLCRCQATYGLEKERHGSYYN